MTSTPQHILQRESSTQHISSVHVDRAKIPLSEEKKQKRNGQDDRQRRGIHLLFYFRSNIAMRGGGAANKSLCSVLPEKPEWLLIPHSWPRGCRRQRKLPCPPAITYLFTAMPTPRRFQPLSSSFCLPPSPSANPL